MRFEFLVFVIMFCLAYGCCGIIGNGYLKSTRDDAVTSYGSLGSWHNFHSKPLPLVRLRNSIGIERRDLQSQITKRLCANCLMRPQCKVHKKCDLCETWCTPEEISSITTTVKSVDATTEMTNDITVTPIVGSAHLEASEPNVALASRFGGSSNAKNIHMKKIHTIATLKSGYLKEVICKLFGIPDTLDIDTVVVWMTTHSNQPPKYDPEYQKPVTSKAEEMTEKLNEELDKALHAKVKQHGGNYLTVDEIAQVMNRVPMNVNNVPENNAEARNSWPEEYLPTYPINPSDLDEYIPRVLNPPVIEDTPDLNLVSSTKEKSIDSRIRESTNMADDNKQLETGPSNTPEAIVGSEQQGTVVEDNVATPISVTTKEPISVTLLTDETTKNNIENVLTQSSPENTLIVSPFASDSEYDNEMRTTQMQTDTGMGERDKTLSTSPIKPIQSPENHLFAENHHPRLSATHEDQHKFLTNSENSREENVPSRDDEDSKLRTSKLKQKIGNKKAEKLHGSPIYYTKPYRSNEDPNELIMDNNQRDEYIDLQKPSKEKLADRLGSSKLIQKIKQKNVQKLKGKYQTGPQYYRSNSEEKDAVVGITESTINSENVITPTLGPKEDEVIMINNVNSILTPSSNTQIKIGDTVSDLQNKDIPVEEQIDITTTSNGSFDLDKPTSPSSKDVSENSKETPISLKARTHALLGKIRERIEQRKKESQPITHENIDVKVGSPKDADEPGRHIHTPTEVTNKSGTRYETIKPVDDVGNHNGQEVIKVDLIGQDSLPPAVLVDGFDKAKAALEGVEKLVDDIQRETNLIHDNGAHDKTVGAVLSTSTKLPLTTDKTYIFEPQTVKFTTLKSITEPVETGAGKVIGVTKNIPLFVSDKAKEGIQATESNFEQPLERMTETKSGNIVGSQPLEEIVSYDIGKPIVKIPEYRTNKVRAHLGDTHLASQENVLGAQNAKSFIPKDNIHLSETGEEIPVKEIISTEVTSNERNILGQKSPFAPEDIPVNMEVNTRTRFSDVVEKELEEPTIWSNAMGTIISSQEQTGLVSLEPKDIFFIGNGIKLPLQMVRKNDGAIHLSVDLDRLCSCKNITCPKNHTAIEKTLGTILEKEAELKDQLAEAESANLAKLTTTKPTTHGLKSSILRSQRGTIIDNRAKRPLHSKLFNSKVGIFKRSIDENKLKDSDETLPNIHDNMENMRSVYDQTIKENSDKNTELVKNKINNTIENEKSNLSPFLFKQLMDRKIVELKSKMFNIGKNTDVLKNHLLFPQTDINILLNKIGKELGKNSTATQINTSGEELSDNKANGHFPFSSIPMAVESRSTNSLKKRYDEKLDDLIPIKKVYKFEKLEEELADKMNKFNDFVTQYVEENKKIINEGAKDLIRIHEDGTLKKEIDIMNKLITWMKYIPVHKDII